MQKKPISLMVLMIIFMGYALPFYAFADDHGADNLDNTDLDQANTAFYDSVYLALRGGIATVNDRNVTDLTGKNHIIDHDLFLTGSVEIGARFWKSLRLSVESGFQSHTLYESIFDNAGIFIQNNDLDRSLNLGYGVGNIYLDLTFDGGIRPYFIVGTGAMVKNRVFDNGTDFTGLYRFGGGLGLKLSENTVFDWGYRFHGSYGDISSEESLKSHHITAGIRYHF